MSAILEGTPDKKLALVTGRAYPEQAHETAKYLGIDVLETTAYDFANGEMYVRYTEPVRGADAFVMQAHTEPINKWIMEQLIMVDAMKRASARSITVVAPFLAIRARIRSIRPRAHHRPTDFRPVPRSRRRPYYDGRSACRPGAGFLRWTGRPSHRHSGAA